MADSLSAAASIAGLVTLAAHITKLINSVKKSHNNQGLDSIAVRTDVLVDDQAGGNAQQPVVTDDICPSGDNPTKSNWSLRVSKDPVREMS